MEELLASQSFKPANFSKGQEVEGEVVFIDERELILDLGAKSEGVLSRRDLGEKEPKIGDKLKVFVLEPESESGLILLTAKSAAKPQSRVNQTGQVSSEKWAEITKKYPEGEIIKGTVSKISQFGVFVKLEDGIEGLIHSSKLNSDSTHEVGQEMSVIIDSLDEDKKRISLSPMLTSTKGLIYK